MANFYFTCYFCRDWAYIGNIGLSPGMLEHLGSEATDSEVKIQRWPALLLAKKNGSKLHSLNIDLTVAATAYCVYFCDSLNIFEANNIHFESLL